MSDESASERSAPWAEYERLSARDIVAKLRESDPQEIAAVKAYEASRESPRSTVLEFEPPAARGVASGYTPAGWRERARAYLGVSPHLLAGALHDVAADEVLEEADVRQRVAEFENATAREEESDGDS